MTDTVSPEKRSAIMSSVRSRDTKLEARARVRIVEALGSRALWSQPALPGKPDFVRGTSGAPIAIFVDSCFWHGCERHGRIPKTRVEFWTAKIQRNAARDREVTRRLRSQGFVVLRIWEHELAHDGRLRAKLLAALKAARLSPRKRPRID